MHVNVPRVSLKALNDRKYIDTKIPIINVDDIINSKYMLIIDEVTKIVDIARETLYILKVLPKDVRCAIVIGVNGNPTIIYLKAFYSPVNHADVLKITMYSTCLDIKFTDGFKITIRNLIEFNEVYNNYSRVIYNPKPSYDFKQMTQKLKGKDYSDTYITGVEDSLRFPY